MFAGQDDITEAGDEELQEEKQEEKVKYHQDYFDFISYSFNLPLLK